MEMRENMQSIFKALIDETLLRLLYYLPTDANDSPLSSDKPNILGMNELEKWAIINDRIKPSVKTSDLIDVPKCRILFYPSRRIGRGNYMYAEQKIVFDILVHNDFQEVDLRLEWICDTINSLIFNKRITGFGKILYDEGGTVSAPQNYVGYRLVYKFTSENA